ncbi:tryptophan-rich sensory protein [Altererythrobacter arenosus]|uniref:Tryptophan-rich sensory protein n=1 Tax=Altererythrobacter arenosus TaxID=3032592 RepID=A0ABY8FNL2_9SPHN|nr:TspO/MBR family protein [Altererythrobacter sp. CAU 1644]WFL76598.1 tryptophan-rich sensory protein [Altererythrobacter sp. CAU 1644]
MNVVASRGQLRASFLRWALFTVPLIVLLGFVAGQLGSPNTMWFQNLVKPDIYPDPKWFGIVWTILYIMIGIAFALICSAWGARGRGIAVGFFVVHFALNLAWSPVFFGAQNIQGALILLAVIDITLLVVIFLFWRVRRAAGLLLLPYLAWVLFATLLNYEFLRLNPDGGHGSSTSATQRIEI